MMDYVNYFCWLLVICVTAPLFYIPAGILSIYGFVVNGLTATEEPTGSRLSRGILVPSLIAVLSLVVGTIYGNSLEDTAMFAHIGNLALWLLQIPVIATVVKRSGAYWVGALCFGIAQLWFACLTYYVASLSIAGAWGTIVGLGSPGASLWLKAVLLLS